MTAPDRDQLLAAIYGYTYGQRILGTIACKACRQPYDLEFQLLDLMNNLQADVDETLVQPKGNGTYRLADGRHFRLPTAEDELAVWHLPEAEAERALLQRCVLEGDPEADPALIQSAMQTVGPVLDLDLNATCPECGEQQAFHFDIQSYLLSALQSEQAKLTQEIHRIATVYDWSLHEILGLTRRQRQAYVDLIEREQSRRS